MCEMWNDGDSPTVWKETPRTARKEHRCDSCRGIIRSGKLYFVHFSLYDGRTYSEKCCSPCQEARREFAMEPGHLLPMPGSFTEALDECVTDQESTPAERKKWKGVLRNIERRGKRAKASEVSQ
jgi:hypothetical protein